MSKTLHSDAPFSEAIKMDMLPTLSFRNTLKGSIWQKRGDQWVEIYKVIKEGDLERLKDYIARVAQRENRKNDKMYLYHGIMISIMHDQVEILEFLRNLLVEDTNTLSFYFVWAVLFNSSKLIDKFINDSRLNLNEQWTDELPKSSLSYPDLASEGKYLEKSLIYVKEKDSNLIGDTIFGGLTKMSTVLKKGPMSGVLRYAYYNVTPENIFPTLKRVLQNGHDRIIDLDRFKAYIFYKRELMAGTYYDKRKDDLDSLDQNKEYNELLDEVNKSMEAQKAVGLTSQMMRVTVPLLHSQSEFEYRSVENIISESKKPRHPWGPYNKYVPPTTFEKRYWGTERVLYPKASGPIDMFPGDRRGGKRTNKSHKIRKYRTKTRKNCR
jgi:hypothetical protein